MERQESNDCKVRQLCRKYGRIKSVIDSFAISEDGKEKLMRDIFVAAYNKLDKLHDAESMDRWLNALAVKRIIAYKKMYKIRMAADVKSVSAGDRTETTDRIADMIRAEQTATNAEVRVIAGKLAPLEQQIIYLRYAIAAEYRNIAVILDMKQSEVKAVEEQALKKFSRLLEENSPQG